MPPAATTMMPAAEALATPDLHAIYIENASFVRTLMGRLVGNAADPEDLMQEVFVVACRKLQQCPVENVRAWLVNIAIRLAVSARRRDRFRTALRLRHRSTFNGTDWQTPERRFEQGEANRLVYAALEGLSEKKRTAFILYELQGLSGNEIAEALDCPVKTVWTRLFHARREFLSRIEAAEQPPQR